MGVEGHGSMVDKRYYEKPGGFAYLLDELRKRLGEERHGTIGRGSDKCDFYRN